MRILLVTLDLKAGISDALFDALKNQGSWWHYMKPTWLLYTDKTPDEVVDALKPHMEGHGRLLVVPLTRPYQGLLPDKAWKWIRERVDADQ
jgi:hypothetical protein